jgi:hypothetical protein
VPGGPAIKEAVEGPTTAGGVPWFYPAATLGVIAAFKGGWGLVDRILNTQRKSQANEELARAKGEFNQALLAEYPRHQRKTAAEADPLAVALDELYDEYVKTANWYNPLDWVSADTKGKALGSYLTYAGLTGLMAGSAAYEQAQKSSRRAILQKALAKRNRSMYAARPSEVFARPVRTLPPPSETELEPTPGDEAATEALS